MCGVEQLRKEGCKRDVVEGVGLRSAALELAWACAGNWNFHTQVEKAAWPSITAKNPAERKLARQSLVLTSRRV